MQHETTLLLALIALETLSIVGRAKSRGHKSLCLTTGKERRAVNTREHPNLDRKIANLIECPVVWPNAFLQNLFTEDVFAQNFVVFAELFRCRWIVFRKLFLQIVLNCFDQRIALKLRMLLRVKRILQPRTNLCR